MKCLALTLRRLFDGRQDQEAHLTGCACMRLNRIATRNNQVNKISKRNNEFVFIQELV